MIIGEPNTNCRRLTGKITKYIIKHVIKLSRIERYVAEKNIKLPVANTLTKKYLHCRFYNAMSSLEQAKQGHTKHRKVIFK